ncbi:hypothetical protein JQK87_17195 [Streptomyces sp. G44]|uniref:hypothetical protein n=1 Tax=Streptomyces sp. G44 TaxID=2807632 RepID=UPI001961CF73|nr:hypothetical protein [Streptomyces sp. G44]MBM7170116.1 hypothetical protein [Streptomyces sp. G44]
MTEVFLRRLSRWQAEQQRESVADLCVEACRGMPGAGYRDRQAFLERFEQDVRQPGFDMVVADAGGLAGCLYGYRAAPTGEWWDGFRGTLPAGVEGLTASGRVFLLSELMVVPARRRAGVATRLWTLLVSRHTADAVVAVIRREDERGRAVLRAWGWEKLGESAPGPGDSAPGREGWLRPPTPPCSP